MSQSSAAILFEQVTKTYYLYNSAFDRVREALLFFRPPRHKPFNALDDISFRVGKGEFVGIIGQNGSGKSTLLKLVTGVANQTSGRIAVNGRISALLELGAGFNPDMTGIENIYFAGTFMGRSRAEIDAGLDDIVAFADIGDYIHQPVKLYSSGMYVRLGFSLAINVNPDILVVDEALSVGDVRFQQKCLRRIKKFQEDGKTILLVSHDLRAIKTFCQRVVWIHSGRIREEGDPSSVVKNYLSFMNYGQIGSASSKNPDPSPESDLSKIPWDDVSGCSSFGDGRACIEGVYLYDETHMCRAQILKGGERLALYLKIQVHEDIENPFFGFYLSDRHGLVISNFNTKMANKHFTKLTAQTTYTVHFSFEFPHIANGDYQMSIAVADGERGPDSHIQNHWVHDAVLLKMDNESVEYKVGGIVRIFVDTVELSQS